MHFDEILRAFGRGNDAQAKAVRIGCPTEADVWDDYKNESLSRNCPPDSATCRRVFPSMESSQEDVAADITTPHSVPLHRRFGVEFELLHIISRAEAAKLLNDRGIICKAVDREQV